ncbi:MAG: hypothetical protein SXU28_00925 [Pseudomonadota bacterium]|nr:hypothetical protein [Pseudomonadota bacterium]
MSLARAFAIVTLFCAWVLPVGASAQNDVTAALPALTDMKLVRSNMPDAPKTLVAETDEIPDSPTRIHDKAAAERIFANEGITLQWIGWEKRGQAWVAVDEGGHWVLMAGQYAREKGTLDLEGFITEIGSDYFIFEGTVKIFGAPDKERMCRKTKPWRFAITQNRKYYRLREFEWCDGLTDYIDLYFKP